MIKILWRIYKAFGIESVLERKIRMLEKKEEINRTELHIWLKGLKEYLEEDYPKSKIFRPIDLLIFVPLRILGLLGFLGIAVFSMYCLITNKDYLITSTYLLDHPLIDWFLLDVAVLVGVFIIAEPIQLVILMLMANSKIVKKYPILKED